MYENIFQRVEKKYLLTEEQKKLLLSKIQMHLIEDQYFESKICNIYFDNDNNDLIINSLEKPIYKDKLRLRSYKVPSLEDDVFLELKEKYKSVVGKRRVKMKLKEFYQFIEEGIYDSKNQMMKEFAYYFSYYDLKPKIFIAYDRLSYRSKEDKNLRITIDQKLRSRRNDLSLEKGDHGKLYFEQNYYIMEIKTLGSMPKWLVDVLSSLKIYPTSFSKYGSIYKKELIEGGMIYV